MKLKRELGLLNTTLYGIGVILGAGIYALIAVGAGLAGNMLWLAFLLSAVIAVFTGLSYAELSGLFPKEAAEYNYTRRAFKHESLSFAVGWVLAIGTAIAASTVALAFGGYFSTLTGLEPKISAVALIGVMTLLNYVGIKESAKFNMVATGVEMLGLVIVIIAGFLAAPVVEADFLELPPGGIHGILAAISVIFFAYIGFENLANISEEVKDSRKTVPKALVLSLAISTILYILVALAAVRELGWEALSQSQAPLTLVVESLLGNYAHILSYIALFATANTVLMFLIAASRIIYGISDGGSLPKSLSDVGRRGTPYLAVASIGVLAAVIASAADLQTVAQLADLAVFMAYLAVNASLIYLAAKGALSKEGFLSPRIAGVPVLAWLGVLSALFMMFFFDINMWMMQGVIILAGLALFVITKKR